MKTQSTILREILTEVDKVGPIRRLVIAFLFPEFAAMLGKLAELSETVDE